MGMDRRDTKFRSIMGDRVRQARESRGWTIDDFAERAYVTRSAVRDLEYGGSAPAEFLRRFSEVLGTNPHDLINPNLSLDFYSVFVSYGGPDEEIARSIYRALRRRRVRCFFFPESARPGVRLHRTMNEGVREFDRVLLLCSRSSLKRSGVQNEIEQVLAREAAEGGAELLIPIALDDFVFKKWSPERTDLATQIRNRVVADFRGTSPRTAKWRKQMQRVLDALRKNPPPAFNK